MITQMPAMSERSMELTPDELTAAVLQLPAHLRAELAERLITSLSDDTEIDPEWFAELHRRDVELDRAPNRARCIPSRARPSD